MVKALTIRNDKWDNERIKVNKKLEKLVMFQVFCILGFII